MRVLLLILLIPYAAGAGTTTVVLTNSSVTADAQINIHPTQTTNYSRNYGGLTTFRIGQGGVHSIRYRSLLWFDVTSIPANATIISAACSLYTTIPSASFYARVDSLPLDWVEGNGTGTFNTLWCSWGKRGTGTGLGGTFIASADSCWGSPCADFQGVFGYSPANRGYDSLLITTGDAAGYKGWDVTGIANDLFHQQVVGTSTTGFGMVFYHIEIVNNGFVDVVSSEESITPDRWPKLVVTYSVPDAALRSQVIFVSED